jgi:murein L,D-transpeptidase YafK
MLEHRATVEIVVEKRERRLSVYQGAALCAAYRIALGRNPAVDKTAEGDEATPLGEFYICAKNPRSKYFLSLCLSYPGTAHARRGLAAGLISASEYAAILEAHEARRMPPQKTRLGGEIYIHGRAAADSGAATAGRDWTRGCIALDNRAMAEIYALAELGTPVRIVE